MTTADILQKHVDFELQMKKLFFKKYLADSDVPANVSAWHSCPHHQTESVFKPGSPAGISPSLYHFHSPHAGGAGKCNIPLHGYGTD